MAEPVQGRGWWGRSPDKASDPSEDPCSKGSLGSFPAHAAAGPRAGRGSLPAPSSMGHSWRPESGPQELAPLPSSPSLSLTPQQVRGSQSRGPPRVSCGGGEGLLPRGCPTHHPVPPPGLKRGVCVKINHFPEDTDYDHDSAEYLLRTWGPPRGPPHLDGHAEMASRPIPGQMLRSSASRLAQCFVARPFLSPRGGRGAGDKSWVLIGHCSLGPPAEALLSDWR